MTIEQWGIVLNATIGALLVGYGVWFRYVLEHQLRSKDTAIQALEAALKAKDAEISRLQGDTAPAIAAAYSTMREHANLATEESQRLLRQVTELTQEQQRLEKVAPVNSRLSECIGLRVAYKIIHLVFNDIYEHSDLEHVSPETSQALIDGVLEAYKKIIHEYDSRLSLVRDSVSKQK